MRQALNTTMNKSRVEAVNRIETYYGQVRTLTDAIIVLEACQLGMLPRVQGRLSKKEDRKLIRAGSVFAWEEREAGMQRWTDGRSWSASRVSGSFLNYREREAKRERRGSSSHVQNRGKYSNLWLGKYQDKPDGLRKRAFSFITATGLHLHLVSYHSPCKSSTTTLPQPSTDPSLRHIRPETGLYPVATFHDNLVMSRVFPWHNMKNRLCVVSASGKPPSSLPSPKPVSAKTLVTPVDSQQLQPQNFSTIDRLSSLPPTVAKSSPTDNQSIGSISPSLTPGVRDSSTNFRVQNEFLVLPILRRCALVRLPGDQIGNSMTNPAVRPYASNRGQDYQALRRLDTVLSLAK